MVLDEAHTVPEVATDNFGLSLSSFGLERLHDKAEREKAEQELTRLSRIQQALFERAVRFREEHTSRTDSYDEFKSIMEGRPGFVVSPWCGSAECEATIKTETQATIRNIPFSSVTPEGKGCIKCGQPAVASAWFAKAY